MIKILIGNITARIIGHLPDEVHDALDQKLSYTPKDIRHITSVKNGKWDGRFRLYKKSWQTFDSGLMSLATTVLDDHGIEYHKVDERKKPEVNLPHLYFNPVAGYEKRDYQQFSIDRAYNRTRGILQMATGAGKTVTVAELIGKIQTAPFMFYVLTKDLMDQAYDTLSSTLNEPIGRIGGGLWDIQKINVCTIQTAIRSINLGNKSFKISDYRFDEEDLWDKKDLEGEDKLSNLKQLLHATKGLYFDECLTGDTTITTEFGKTTIENAVKNKCRFVQTYDGNNIIFKPILNWWDKGVQKTLEITLLNGRKIRCTKNHLFFTEKGWVEAQNLKTTDQLFFANAAVDKRSSLQINIDRHGSYSDIKNAEEQETNGQLFTTSMLQRYHVANAVAEEKFPQDINLLINLLRLAEECLDTQNILMVTTNSPIMKNTIYPLLSRRLKQSLEHVLAIHAFYCPTNDLKITDYHQHMEFARQNGQNIKNNIYLDTELNVESTTTKGLEKNQLFHGHPVYPVSLQSQKKYIAEIAKMLINVFWIQLEQLDWHGGYAMTDQTASDVYHYTQKVGQKKKIPLLQNGLIRTDLSAKFNEHKSEKNTYTILDLIQLGQNDLPNTLENMCRNSCNTNWTAIKSIKIKKSKRVYDIEVQDTHCFFANGILVHNCHHASAKTCKDVINASPNAFWKYGGSATPYREDGAEIVLQSLFGRKIVEISASYLIDHGYLLEPYIFFEPVYHDCKLHAYQSIYSECVVKDDAFNLHVADTANFLIEHNLSTLILVQQIAHGKFLQEHIPGSVLVTGNLSSKKREQAIQDLRDKKKLCMIATCLADEGLDIPTLDVALLAGGGSSATRVNQRIGRTLRIDRKSANPRNRAVVVYYRHYVKYLEDHALKAARIMKKEPRFNVVKSKGKDHILGEISEVFGLDYHPKTIFNI